MINSNAFPALLTIWLYFLQVETLLASFLKDVGISEEQFMTACKDGSGSPQFNGMHRVGGEMWYFFEAVYFFLHFSFKFKLSPKAIKQKIMLLNLGQDFTFLLFNCLLKHMRDRV